MHHLFLGINPASLVKPPYKPANRSAVAVSARRVGLNLGKDCPIMFLPLIGGFVGSDALAVIISSSIYKSKSHKLAIDIGTNGEIVLGNKERIFVASTAAGPAFEARYIKCGMPAIEGAIESVKIKGSRADIKVIGNVSPKGVCGSGIIDAVAQMRKQGLIDASGRINVPEFVIYKKGKTKISISQQDIRKLQLAKAAIYAAARILLRKSRLKEKDIKELLITGSFGNTINPESVATIGLIPKINKRNIRFLKNGALGGLRQYLTTPALEGELSSILGKVRHIPLFGRGFVEEFTSSMSIGG
jgi:uncharacterized 2Fe-2S/4Fe-4S cluster protein (DUF4445 family)